MSLNAPMADEPERIYVIGDVHGRRDLLDRIIDHIHADLAADGITDALTVALGDYVDRGPDAKGVLDLLASNPLPIPFVPLLGNHEAMLLQFLDDPDSGTLWRRNGGLETLYSYGIPVRQVMAGKGYHEAAQALRAALPEAHAAFLASLRPFLALDAYFFCHAGVRPGIALDRQSIDDQLWIRDEFLDSTADFGRIVVHGHTPTEWPEVLPNRINIDTGAFATGRLTCLVLTGSERRFLYTG